MSLTVRAATPDDAATLAYLGAKTFYDTFRPYNTEEDMEAYISKAYNEPLISSNLLNPDIRYAIVYNQEIPVGYTKLLLKAGHEKLQERCVEMEKIYVLDSVLGSGAGQLLMDDAITFAKQHRFDTLFLGVWEENKRAVRFYEKNGFTVFAHRSFMLGTTICDDFMMKTDLHQQA